MKKTVLITGASQGIGRAAAQRFHQLGYQVVALARTATQSAALRSMGVACYDADLSNEQELEQVCRQILAKHPVIDVLVNNAGYCQNGFVEELTLQQLRHQFEVNVFGLLRVTQLILPAMRKAGTGRIINIGSAGGDFTSPGASAYHASKYAIESFTDGLRMELRPFGIGVALIKPGGVATTFAANASASYPAPIAGNPYQQSRQRFLQMLDTILDPQQSSAPLLTPDKVVDAIVTAAQARRPRTRYRVGMLAHVLPMLKRLLSDRAFDNMLLRQLKLT